MVSDEPGQSPRKVPQNVKSDWDDEKETIIEKQNARNRTFRVPPNYYEGDHDRK